MEAAHQIRSTKGRTVKVSSHRPKVGATTLHDARQRRADMRRREGNEHPHNAGRGSRVDDSLLCAYSVFTVSIVY